MTRLVAFTVAVALVAFFCWVLYVCIDRSELVEPARVVTEQKFPTSWPSTTSTSQPSHVQVITSVPRARTHPTAPSERSDIFHSLAMCETGGTMNPRAYNPAGPYYSFFQFSAATWRALGGTGLPWDHPYSVQKAMAQKAVNQFGWASQFPACSRKLGVA